MHVLTFSGSIVTQIVNKPYSVYPANIYQPITECLEIELNETLIKN